MHEQVSMSIARLPNFMGTSIRVTPFSILYDTEAVLPVEIEIHSLWMEIELEIAKWVHRI